MESKIRVLFIYFNIHATLGIHSGIASLSAVLKRYGCDVQLEIVTEPERINELYRKIEDYNPNILAFSLVETQIRYTKPFIETLSKKEGMKVIVGGPYPTMDPEMVRSWTNVDVIFIGESEDDIIHYILEDQARKHFEDSGILSIQRDFYGPSLIKSLSTLPPEDKNLFPLEYIIDQKNHQLEANIGRGCMYQCTYCINDSFLTKYHLSKPEYIRMKSLPTIYEEIMPYTHRYHVKKIAFTDDDFFLYALRFPREMDAFYQAYRANVGLPFNINVNPLTIDEKRVENFRNAGGYGVRLGIESSERLRIPLLHRPITNKLLLEKCGILSKYNIEVSTYNMIGLPTETKEDILEILRLNRQVSPEYVKIMTFFPFRGTPLYDKCHREGLINEEKRDRLDNYVSESCLNFDSDYLAYLKYIQDNFHLWLETDFFTYEKVAQGLARRVIKSDFYKPQIWVDDKLMGDPK